MGNRTFSRDAFHASVDSFTSKGKSSTFRGEETVKNTGKLDPLVDPAGYGVIRPSRMRMTELESGLWEVSVGAPGTLEYRLDTTGSMGTNVERAIRVLPQTCELTGKVMPGRDPFFCASIFGDRLDQFILCRGQFEVLADRMVNQLTLMHPEGGGYGNGGEDPHYGLFGAAYLTDAYLQRLGLKTMDFTITDEPTHEPLLPDQLKRVFGEEVFEKCKENGYDFNSKNLPTNEELVKDLHKRCHAFVLLVDSEKDNYVISHWQNLYRKDHVILLPDINQVSHVMASVTGLTEGTLDLSSTKDFLTDSGLSKNEATKIVNAVAHIPLGAQCALPNYSKLPKKRDIFANKTDLFPMDPKDIPADLLNGSQTNEKVDTGGWL